MYLGASVFRYVKLDHMYEGQLYMTEMKILEYLSLFFKIFVYLATPGLHHRWTLSAVVRGFYFSDLGGTQGP